MNKRIWIADDDESILWVADKALEAEGYAIRLFNDGHFLLEALGNDCPDLVISDIHMPQLNGFDLLQSINELHPALPVIIITAFGDLDSAVDSYKLGAFEYLTKPFDIDELCAIVSKAISQVTSKSTLVADKTPIAPHSDKVMIGDSPKMQEVFRMIGRIAKSDMGVLIRGESGTGKELVADAIHKNSARSEYPLIAINTAAIPGELLESELFGHEKGAFTGAHDRHIGRFEQAHQGTLFLDEIGDMPGLLQTRLLRVLSEGRFFRVGGRKEISVDVRIIAATNQPLESMVESGSFRNDLFHRLNVLALTIPPLRERPEDIAALVHHFIAQFSNGEDYLIDEGVIESLQSYPWPGNIRELRNIIQQVIVLNMGRSISINDLPANLSEASNRPIDGNWQTLLELEVNQCIRSGERNLVKTLGQKFENILILAALDYTNGHRQKAAKILGWGRNTISQKIRQLSDD